MRTIAVVELCMISREGGGLSKPQKSGSCSLHFHFARGDEYELYGGRLDTKNEVDIQAGLGPIGATFFFLPSVAVRTVHPGHSFTIRCIPTMIVGFGFVRSMIFLEHYRCEIDTCASDSSGWLMTPDYFDWLKRCSGNTYPADPLPEKDSWWVTESILPWRGITARVAYEGRSGPGAGDANDGYAPQHRFGWSEKQFVGIHFNKDYDGKEREVVIRFLPWQSGISQARVDDEFEILEGDGVVGHGVVTGTLP